MSGGCKARTKWTGNSASEYCDNVSAASTESTLISLLPPSEVEVLVLVLVVCVDVGSGNDLSTQLSSGEQEMAAADTV